MNEGRSDKARAILHDAYMQGYRDGQSASLAGGRQTPRRHVARVLLERLQGEPQPAELMLSLSDECGVSQNTVRRAAKEVGVFKVKRGDCWLWVHPRQAPPALKVTKVTSQSTLFVDRPINPYTDDCATA